MCVPHFPGIEVVPESGQPSGTGGIRAYLSPAPQAVPQAAGCSWDCLSPAPQAVPQAVGCSWGCLSPAPQAVPQAAGCSWGCLSPAPQAVPQAAAAAFSRASLWNRFFNDIEITMPTAPLSAQIGMKESRQTVAFLVELNLRRKHTTTHGRESRRLDRKSVV